MVIESSGSHLLPFSFDNENVVNEASRCAMGRQRETRNNKTFLSKFFSGWDVVPLHLMSVGAGE